MIMGADVSHPAPESRKCKPSIVAVTGSVEPKATQYETQVSYFMLLFELGGRGEYFYLRRAGRHGLILLFSCRNIQFGVFCTEMFILWCIVQKYWSGIVTCYMKMRQINELHADLASFLLNCARKKHFLGGFVQKCHFFWGLCRNITVPSYCTSGVLCRAFFRGCAEILIFGEMFTSAQSPLSVYNYLQS